MKDDTISRQAAIDAMEESKRIYVDRRVIIGKMQDIVSNLPSAQPEQRWIPVSERMPEPRIDVWCNSDMGQMVGYYDEYAETWYGRDYLELIVTAWMPLPEPPKEQKND